METRNVNVTLEKAQEWYKKGGDLKEVALQAFTEEELTTPKFTDIKDFWGAVRALGLDRDSVQDDLSRLSNTLGFETNTVGHLRAIYKLDIIRKALNKGWNPKMTKGSVYYPYVRFYSAGNKAKEAARSNGWEVKETFNADGQKYALVGGDYFIHFGDGIAGFSFKCGIILPNLGLLGCKSEEIAKHMSRYFAKEIFEATYAQHVGTYEWV